MTNEERELRRSELLREIERLRAENRALMEAAPRERMESWNRRRARLDRFAWLMGWPPIPWPALTENSVSTSASSANGR
jgi:hypothetical protein